MRDTMPMPAIPAFECKVGCHECCGPVPWSPSEFARLLDHLRAQGRALPQPRDLSCPFVAPAPGGCSVYEVRPFVCRIYGTLQDLLCPHGHRPDAPLTPAQGLALLRDYVLECLPAPVFPGGQLWREAING